MFTTLSEGVSGFKNYFLMGGYYYPTLSELLPHYYFTGAFTGGEPAGVSQILAAHTVRTGGEGRNRPSLVFHKPLEINRLWHR